MFEANVLQAAPAPTTPLEKCLFRNILLATDFSPSSDRALDYAASLARRFGSAIYLTHIIGINGYPLMAPELAASHIQRMHEEANQRFREILKSGRLMALPYQMIVREGTLWPTLAEVTKEFDIDLLVTGAHGAGAVGKLLVGSGAEEIFRRAGIPVLTVGPKTSGETPYDLEFKNILFATDFGKSAEREADFAFSLAQEHRSRLRVLHVFPHPEAYGEEVLVLEKEHKLAQLRKIVPADSELHCKLDFEVAVGDPVEQILRIASEMKADVIVMGAKARRSLAGNIPHTKAYRVVSNAPCPVLTIRS